MPPAIGQKCIVCNHPALVLINNQINEGASDYKLAGQFDLPRNSVRHHRTKGHPGVKPAAMTRGTDLASVRRGVDAETLAHGPDLPPLDTPPGEEGDPRTRMEMLLRQLQAQASEGDVRPDIAREIRLGLEALAKMGASTPPPVVRAQDVEGLIDLMLEMHRALQPFPEAKAALREVWRSHGLHVGQEEEDA